MALLQDRDVHLIDYVRLILKRRYFVLICLSIVLAGTIIETARTVPMYQSTSMIKIDDPEPYTEFPAGPRRYSVRLDTEMGVMKTAAVLEDAVLNKAKLVKSTDDTNFQREVNRLRGSVSVSEVRSTYLVNVSVTDPDPERAKLLANAVAEAYTDLNYKSKMVDKEKTYQILSQQIDTVSKELALAAKRLIDFQRENRVMDERKSRELESHKGYSEVTDLIEARRKRMEKEAAYSQLKKWYEDNDFSITPPEIATNLLANTIYQDIIKEELELKKLLGIYKPNHPKVQEQRSTVDNLKRQYREEVRKTLDSLDAEAELLARKEQVLKDSFAVEQDQSLKDNELQYQWGMLNRDVEAKQKVYENLLDKRLQVDVEGALVKNNARIVETASRGVKVVPRWNYNLLIGLALGIILGCAGAFFLEYLDKTLKTPEEVESYLGLPVLAIIPMMKKDLIRAPYAPPELLESGEAK
jgi:succinoglycan biosynthesis transport protein ExoP